MYIIRVSGFYARLLSYYEETDSVEIDYEDEEDDDSDINSSHDILSNSSSKRSM